jgi:hypothetical protein
MMNSTVYLSTVSLCLVQVKSFDVYATYGSGLEEGWIDDEPIVMTGGIWQPLLAVGLAISGEPHKIINKNWIQDFQTPSLKG